MLGPGFDSPRLHLFIGHFALGFAAKRAAPRTSLGPLILAPALLDFLWPVFILAGVERVAITPNPNPFLNLTFTSYPWSHSLVMAAVWGALFGGGYYAVTRYRPGAMVLFLLVVSHWVLDVVSHRPDMPVSPWGGPVLGLGLWNSAPLTVVVEAAMLTAGVALYAGGTRARDRIGRFGTAGLVLFLVLGYVSTLLGGAPPGTAAIAIVGLIAGALTVLWAWWVDQHREIVAPAA
ncbi:MAG TPA: hypothetical protein VFK78_06700 [Gemmatimonadales bacterium]|nr:hypothetical protein [Gemmatimonadales bacterium]